MLPITEQMAISKVNKIIAQTGLGVEYRVFSVREAKFGWLMYWIPKGNQEKEIAGSGPYMVSRKNGIVKEFVEVAHRNNLNPRTQPEEVIAAFIRETETVIRQ